MVKQKDSPLWVFFNYKTLYKTSVLCYNKEKEMKAYENVSVKWFRYYNRYQGNM